MSIPGTYSFMTQSSGITYIGSGGRQAATDNLVLNIHSSTIVGDFVVAYLQYDDSSSTNPAVPTGWTGLTVQTAAGVRLRIIYRFFDGTEPTITLTASEHILATSFTFRGVSAGSPIDNSFVTNPDLTFGTADGIDYYVDVAGTSSLTTVTPNSYVLAFAAHETESSTSNWFTTIVSSNLSGIQELADYATSIGWGGGVGVWGGFKLTAGTVNAIRVVTTALVDQQAIVFALRPA